MNGEEEKIECLLKTILFIISITLINE